MGRLSGKLEICPMVYRWPWGWQTLAFHGPAFRTRTFLSQCPQHIGSQGPKLGWAWSVLKQSLVGLRQRGEWQDGHSWFTKQRARNQLKSSLPFSEFRFNFWWLSGPVENGMLRVNLLYPRTGNIAWRSWRVSHVHVLICVSHVDVFSFILDNGNRRHLQRQMMIKF